MADGGGDKKKALKNVGGAQRRTWDLAEYEKRALERAEGGDDKREGDVDSRPLRDREEFKKAETGAAGPAGSARAFVKHRETNLNLTNAIGKTQVSLFKLKIVRIARQTFISGHCRQRSSQQRRGLVLRCL